MNKAPMHYARLVEKNSSGEVVDEIRFWHTVGGHIYLYQHGDGPVNPDPIASDPEGKVGSMLLYTVETAWRLQTGMEVEDVNLNYR